MRPFYCIYYDEYDVHHYQWQLILLFRSFYLFNNEMATTIRQRSQANDSRQGSRLGGVFFFFFSGFINIYLQLGYMYGIEMRTSRVTRPTPPANTNSWEQGGSRCNWAAPHASGVSRAGKAGILEEARGVFQLSRGVKYSSRHLTNQYLFRNEVWILTWRLRSTS